MIPAQLLEELKFCLEGKPNKVVGCLKVLQMDLLGILT
jgi:hypothetical protein